MTSISKFDSQIYSEELYNYTESEHAEVMQAMAEDDGWQGYSDWASQFEETERAAALEQYAFERKQERKARVTTSQGSVFINRDCSLGDCKTSRCGREIRFQGVAI